jgi:hypothetical protein
MAKSPLFLQLCWSYRGSSKNGINSKLSTLLDNHSMKVSNLGNTISKELHKLVNFNTLDLQCNNFLKLSNLGTIQKLCLSIVHFTFDIPFEFEYLQNLLELHLYSILDNLDGCTW